MEQGFIPILIGVTSLSAYLFGRRRFGLSQDGLKAAVGKMLESLGMAFVFLIVNLALGMTAILTARLLTGGFVSLYPAGDVVILVLSLLQGIIFSLWWRSGCA